MAFRWSEWRRIPEPDRDSIACEAADALARLEERNGVSESALYSMLGHKGDLMFLHYRSSVDELNAAELLLARLRLWDYLQPITSYISVVELGLYESSVQTYESLAARGIEPFSPEWDKEIAQVIERQREAMKPRLYPEIPPTRYLCFYPMNRRRGEEKNWYTLPIEERRRQMRDHGAIGRRYGADVKQIITGSIGFDDWEWGVDLFADDPLVFKRLIYEMRFDEASANYADFGQFFIGVHCPAAKLPNLLQGELPHKLD